MLRLPPILRPRLTVKYCLFSAAAVYVSYCFLLSSPLFASNLPKYTGPYAVGTIDVEAPCPRRSTNPFRLKESGDPAFPLDTVLFSLYYPATHLSKAKPRHYWIPKPIWVTGEGYLRFGHVNNFITNNIVTAGLWSLAGGITIPAAVDAPIGQPNAALELQDHNALATGLETSDGFPVVVFSHGFASSRTDYTHYLGEIASRGYVVAAVEHRDGSGPGSVVMKKGSSDRVVFPIRLSDLQDHPDLNASSFKQAQLNFREAEVKETLRVLRRIDDGQGDEVYKENRRKEGQDLTHWRNRFNMNEITMAGHSFGATLAVHTLPFHSYLILTPSQLQVLNPASNLPFKGCIALDP